MRFLNETGALYATARLIAPRPMNNLSKRGIRKRSGSEGIGGLATLEGAIFGLMGLLLAFTISGALQRFGDRRQLVIRGKRRRPPRRMTG